MKNHIAINTTQHNMVNARDACFSCSSWHIITDLVHFNMQK
jgi:hypothetical protein